MKRWHNDDAVSAVIAADCRGEPPQVMKALYVRRNAFDVGLDVPIYRIVRLDYLLDDILYARLTHTRIGHYKRGDSSENPLLDREFVDPQKGQKFTLNCLVENMFASCWSVKPLDETAHWAAFSHGGPSVRIESTVGRVLGAVMADSNPHYSVQHSIGMVQYISEAELDSFFYDPDFSKHLDGLGHGLHLSLMRLGLDMESEDEVRLVYDFMPNESWVKNSVSLPDKDHAQVPFEWADVIQSVVVGPFVRNGGQKDTEEELRKRRVICPISSSKTRAHSG